MEAEALAILSAALRYIPGLRENPRTAAAKRWLPWLCAFSGARVREMGQLRRQDLQREGELWVLRITPEAGTVKTDEARHFVLHKQLIDLGFPAFVQASPEGPLFVTPGKSGDVLGPLAGLLNRNARIRSPHRARPQRSAKPRMATPFHDHFANQLPCLQRDHGSCRP